MREDFVTRSWPTRSPDDMLGRAYSFRYDMRSYWEWRVWRPDRYPHHFGHYKTKDAADRSAARINAMLDQKRKEKE